MLKSAFLAIAVVGMAHSASAVTVETTQFLSSPTYFNGFENIASSSAFTPPYLFSSSAVYSEGGITVGYGGSTSYGQIWTQYQFVGTNGWYPNGGGNGYTKVTLANGGTFSALQFLAGTGFGSSTTYYEALNNGSVVSTGTIGPVFGGDGASLRYYGLSGGGFDEVHLKSNFGGAFNPSTFEAGSFDSFAATASGAVPEPAQWLLMMGGFGLVGAAIRRRSIRSVLA